MTKTTLTVTDAMIEAGIRELNYYDGEQQSATVESIYLAMQAARTPTNTPASQTDADDALTKQLLIDADEMEACGAGNEAANMRKLVARLKEYRRAAITAMQRGG